MALKKIFTLIAGGQAHGFAQYHGSVQIIDEDSFLKFSELMSKIFPKEYKRLSLVMVGGLNTQLLVFPCITPCGNC